MLPWASARTRSMRGQGRGDGCDRATVRGLTPVAPGDLRTDERDQVTAVAETRPMNSTGIRARLEHRLTAGDHRLLVARVLQAHTEEDSTSPLIYHNGEYGTFKTNSSHSGGPHPNVSR